MPKDTKNLKDQVRGQWTILEYDGIRNGNSYWYCRCSCGFEKPVKAQYLLNGTSTKCQKCAIPKRANIVACIPQFYWRHIITNANKRNISILISKEFCYDLLVSQNFKCALSGKILSIATNVSDHNEGKTTASLDRIDSSKPYVIGNLQWLHKDVNMMKHIFTQCYFLSICEDIYNYSFNKT